MTRARAPLLLGVLLALALILPGPAHAARDDGPPVAGGLVLLGSIVPTLALLPVMSGIGVPSNFAPGPDVVTGFDAHGQRLFRRTFSDKIYSFYLFVELDRGKIAALHRLRLEIAGHSLERSATLHGRPAARARSVGTQRVQITWNAQAFPRLSCRDEAGGSPAPLMLDGDFTAADIRGGELRCDFSDGVKTVYADVPVRIDPALGVK